MTRPPLDVPSAMTRVTDPSLAWHAAHANALQRVLAALDFHLPNLQALPASELRAGVDRVRQLVSQTEASHWRDALSLLSGSSEQVLALLKEPRPSIDFDETEDSPVICWVEDYDPEPDAWGVIELPCGFSVTTPFRQVRTQRLPPGTRLVPMSEALHVCHAVACETWSMLSNDLDRALRGCPLRIAWERVDALHAFYASIIQTTLPVIPRGEFDTDQVVPDQMADTDVPQTLVRTANTLRARQFLALAFARDLLAALASNTGEPRSQSTLEELRTTVRRVRDDAVRALREINGQQLRNAGIATDAVVVMPVLRPIPADVPMLALIPEGSVPEVRRVAA